MKLFKKNNQFAGSALILHEKGYCLEYVEALRVETENVKTAKKKALGRSLITNALLFTGRLEESLTVFKQTNLKKLDAFLRANLVDNMIFCLFIQDRFPEAVNLYRELNEYALSEHTDAMRRTVAIYEHINGRYENAVTILIKILNGGCPFVDMCIIKSFLKLDMFDRANETIPALGKYAELCQLGDETLKIKKEISDGLSAKGKGHKNTKTK